MVEIFSFDSEVFVSLDAETPFGMTPTIFDGIACTRDDLWTIHRLEQEVREVKVFETLG